MPPEKVHGLVKTVIRYLLFVICYLLFVICYLLVGSFSSSFDLTHLYILWTVLIFLYGNQFSSRILSKGAMSFGQSQSDIALSGKDAKGNPDAVEASLRPFW